MSLAMQSRHFLRAGRCFRSGQLSPKSWPQLFWAMLKSLYFKGVWHRPSRRSATLRDGTPRKHPSRDGENLGNLFASCSRDCAGARQIKRGRKPNGLRPLAPLPALPRFLQMILQNRQCLRFVCKRVTHPRQFQSQIGTIGSLRARTTPSITVALSEDF